jgi:hypothetical protein
MKTLLLIASFILYSIHSTGQLKHSVTLDYIIYGNVFSSPNKSFFYKENYRYVWPQLNYKIQRGKHGISLSMLGYGKELTYYEDLKEGDLYYYRNGSFMASYSYEFLKYNKLTVNLDAGVNYGIYHHTYIVSKPDPYEYIVDGGKEWALGFTIGANPRLKVWKGFFANGNFRYTLNPFTNNSRHSNTFYVAIGLGYNFGKSRN